MLNSYKTLINGIATALNALKAEVKKLSGKVDNIDLPEIDGQTIVKGADGKLKTVIGGHDYEFLVGRDDSSNIGAGDVIDVDDGTSEGDPRTYYWYSSLTPSSAELAGSVLRDVWTNTASVAVSRVSRVNTNVIAAYGGFSFPALYVVYKDNAEADGITFPKAGTYFMYLFDRVIKGSREQADANLVPSLPLVIDFGKYLDDGLGFYSGEREIEGSAAASKTMRHMISEAINEGRQVWGVKRYNSGTQVFQYLGDYKFYSFALDDTNAASLRMIDLYCFRKKDDEMMGEYIVKLINFDRFIEHIKLSATIDADSTDEQGASAKAVYDAIQAALTADSEVTAT